jgi:hypothetical protein
VIMAGRDTRRLQEEDGRRRIALRPRDVRIIH